MLRANLARRSISSRMSQTETLEEVQRQGKERLYPSLANPNWLVLRRRREIFLRWLENVRSSDLFVLDVGGWIQPYRALSPVGKCAMWRLTFAARLWSM